MGRRNKEYSINLHDQAYLKLTDMFNKGFGTSKHEAIKNGTEKDKIFSVSTYETYKKHIGYFIEWIKEHYPDCTTLKSARRHATEWLEYRQEHIDAKGWHLSASTIATETAAINKLFGITLTDRDRFIPPIRRREDIVRSRIDTERDKHFSVTNNSELIDFCKGTGCRRNILKKLEGRDLWSRDQLIDERDRITAIAERTGKQNAHLNAITEALTTFPDQKYFVHHRKDKGGKYRFAPIVGPKAEQIIRRFQERLPTEKVWRNVHSAADIHSYRNDYSVTVYRMYARELKDIPYDRVRKGTGIKYQHDVYVCRGDRRGDRFDRQALHKVTVGLGHNRLNVCVGNYLRGI